jgi:hypothetical protein
MVARECRHVGVRLQKQAGRQTIPNHIMKKLLWVSITGGYLCLFASSVQATGPTILAGPLYNPTTGHTYFLLNASDWTDAEATAVSMGGHLVTINDAAENDWVVSNFSNFGGTARALWTGFNDAEQEGQFVWSSGETVSYTHWESGQPDNGSVYYPSENFVMIWPSPGPRSPGYWNDAQDENNVVDFGFALYGVVEVTPNNWISLSSGKWESSPSWSLGFLPAAEQVVNILNDGYKAVNIDFTTASGYPSSLTVGYLSVGSQNGLSTLLLNYFGTDTPLRVLNNLNIENNGHVLVLSSSLEVDQTLNVKGILDQVSGELTFNGSAGTIMQIEGGHFNLTNGLVTGANLYLGGTNDGFAYQDSGLVSLNWLELGDKPSAPGSPGKGTYVLQSGWLIVNGPEVVGENGLGTLTQNGGTNSSNVIDVGNGVYVKNGGGLFAGEIVVDAPSVPIFAAPTAILTHAGGTATITNDLRLVGQGNRHNPHSATFNMFGGSLSTPRIQMQVAGLFNQTNGTVNVANELFVDDKGLLASSYSLSGGNLFTSETTLSSSWPESSTFSQSGGTHIVKEKVWINGSAIYQLTGGKVSVPNINLTGSLNYPPQLWVNGAPAFSITNASISAFGGSIVIQDSAQQLGRLTLPADSAINLAGNSAVLRFADSHTNSWQSELFGVTPHLFVYNWNGSTNGGGTDQLAFGASSSGLTASQVAQIHFNNPSGFSPGTYPARILSNGEVVPIAPPTLQTSRSGNQLVLTWPGTYQLLSATNVVGPYQPVSGAASPYAIDPRGEPQRFFRLQQQ